LCARRYAGCVPHWRRSRSGVPAAGAAGDVPRFVHFGRCDDHRRSRAHLQCAAGGEPPRRRRVDCGRLGVAMADHSDYCAALVREADRDRWLATLFAPPDKREALYALYAFAIEIGRVRDVAREPMPGEIRLQWWREVLEGKRDGEAAAHPVAAALLAGLNRHGVKPERLVGIVDAHQFDLYDEPMGTLDDLDNYGVMTQS